MKISSRFGLIAALALTSRFAKAATATGSLPSCYVTGGGIDKLTEDACPGTAPLAYCIDNDKDTTLGKTTPTDEIKSIAWNNGKCQEVQTLQTTNANILSGDKVYFFFDDKNQLLTSPDKVGSAYECTALTNNGITACKSLDSADVEINKYYLNAASDSLSGALVNYSTGGCTLIDAKSNSYYPTKNSYISCDGEKCKAGNQTPGTGNEYYLSTLVGYIIKCTPQNCENIPVTSEAYYLNAGSDNNTSNQLIYCNGSQCEALTTTSGNYVDEDSGKLIVCSASTCRIETNVSNFYISTNPNILIDCTSSPCENIQAKIGIYILGNKQTTSGFIQCDSTSCNELSSTEIEKIPKCEVSSNKCSVITQTSGATEANTLLPEGGYCTNKDGTVLYFATNTIELDDSIVVTSSSNCIQASQTYFQYYYTVGPNIYHIDDGEVSQITAAGYYFINTSTNKLVTGSKIEDYNNSYVKLYKCNGVSCVVIPTPSTTTYYVDVSKRIFKYTGNTFSFAYDKDVLCAYSNNKCIPNTDLKSTEFCVTSAGELVIAATDIEAKKTGDCYKSSTINNEIFGFSSNLYKLNLYDATLIDNTGYYLVSVSSNSTTEFKEFSSKNNDIILYGCSLSSCAVRTPEDGVYYYDNLSHYLVRYDSATSQWSYPTSDGYALVSTEPGEQYVRKFTVDSTATNKVTLTEKVSDGYYYTTDNEMYECPNTEGSSCDLIDESMYVMTNDNELYYCNVDDDNLSSTVCNKQSCVLGELYYIGGYHFRCVTGNIFNILSTKYCNTEEFVVVNFPTAFSETYPSNVKNAVDEISKNNNNTATVKAGSNHLTVIPGIFTNCTYDKEEKMASFDLVCIENYVVLDNEKEPQICSTAKLGFVGCNEDSDNPNKCNPSSAMTIFLSKVAIAFAMVFLGFMLY